MALPKKLTKTKHMVANWNPHSVTNNVLYHEPGNTKGGSITVPLTSCFDCFGLVCFENKNKNCQLSYSWFQTSQTGGQQYNDTSPFSIPCMNMKSTCH